jgi:hypothetical protein
VLPSYANCCSSKPQQRISVSCRVLAAITLNIQQSVYSYWPPIAEQNPGNQKLSLSPSCIIRGSRVEVTSLNSVEVKLVDAQQIGLVWLNVLNVSQRN